MSNPNRSTIEVQGTAISIVSSSDHVFISLTDLVKTFGDGSLIYNWMRNRDTLEIIGTWERIHGPGLKVSNSRPFEIRLA